jgi:3-methyladenine DNA glycosylase AlkD
MHEGHAAMLAELRSIGRFTGPGGRQNDSYGGSGRPYYGVGAPDRRAMVRRWIAGHKAEPAAEVLSLAESLFDGESHEEKTLGAILIAAHPKARAAAAPADVGRWLGRLHGWAEIDSLCQNVFGPEQMLADWPAWQALLEALSRDPNVNKRRAALVLLNAPNRYSGDPRFRDLGFDVIERLKGERDILITKAVSWLLRSMIARHRAAVAAYLAAEAPSLPAIAVRETRVKLATGTKSGRSKTAQRHSP